MSVTVVVSTFAPFHTLAFETSSDTTVRDLHDEIFQRYPFLPKHRNLRLSTPGVSIPDEACPLATLCSSEEDNLVSFGLVPRLLGGKGGFGSQLRAAGGRMSSQKTSNNDSCRDLSGRRLSTIKEAKRLAEYLEHEPDRKKAVQEAKRAKLEALERKLGINKDDDGQNSGRKHRFDDTEYLEQSREIVDSVKSAVAAGLRKKKKAKTTHVASSSLPVAGTSKPDTTTASAAADAAEKSDLTPASPSVIATAAVGA